MCSGLISASWETLPLLTVEDLCVTYGRVAAVRGVSLSCAAGEVVALLGSNGAGKSSTLLGIAGALERATVTGAVSLEGRALQGRPPEQIARSGLALVPERRRIFASLTVRENLLLGASSWAKRAVAAREAGLVLQRFDVLASMCERPAGLLSGGQQQQLAIARALMSRPRMMLLDEPSLGLAPELVKAVFSIISGLRDDGIGVLLVEQNAAQAIRLADRTLVMRKGVIEGTADSHDSELVMSSYFGRGPEPAGTA
jgi:branched-chain amino acid transport system ATP-binding protein